jgi:hypothetical protein
LLQYYSDKIKEDEKGGAHGIYGGKEKENSLENLGPNGRNILKCFLKKDTGKTETELTWLRVGANGVLW